MRLLKLLAVPMFVVGATFVAGAFPGPSGAQTGGAATPNVVLILADDLGWGDVGAMHPASAIRTPHIDRLADEGMRFVDAHSPSGVCTPTRYALLTGRYTWRTRLTRGVLGGYSPPLLEPDRPTLGTLLQAQGYRTAAIGKWHLGMDLPYLDPTAERSEPWEGDPGIDFGGVITDSPVHHGFDEYFGVSASLDMAPYVYIRDDRFTALPTHEQPAVPFPYFIRHGPRADDFVIDEVLDRLVEEAVGFIDRSAQTGDPFFLYFPLTAPHKPTQPHERFRGGTGLGEYGDFVAQVDDAVGQVLAALDRSGAGDETLVIFTSDNGSYMYRRDDAAPDHVDDPSIQAYRVGRHRSNADWRGTKADIWEGGHRVPFVARWPGVVEPGSESTATVVHADLYATLADIVGAAPGPRCRGGQRVAAADAAGRAGDARRAGGPPFLRRDVRYSRRGVEAGAGQRFGRAPGAAGRALRTALSAIRPVAGSRRGPRRRGGSPGGRRAARGGAGAFPAHRPERAAENEPLSWLYFM